jgi:hypothetical protein
MFPKRPFSALRVAALWLALLCISAAAQGHVASKLPLAESERVYIAQIETRGLTLNQKGFPALAHALRTGEVAQVKGFLTPDFGGAVMPFPQKPSFENDILRIYRVSGGSPVSGDADVFAKALFDLRKRFHPEPKVELALMSLLPVDREKLDGAWKGNCALRLVGQRVGGGKTELTAKFDFELATVPDVDAISTAKGWIKSVKMTEAQEVIATQDLMAEVGKERGIDRALFEDNWTSSNPPGERPIVTGGVYVADIDNDTFEDMLITDTRGVFLFRGSPQGKFINITTQSGLPYTQRAVGNAAFADFDNDGFVDLLLDYRAFRNTGKLRFEEVKTDFRFGTVVGFSVGDYDRDGKVDLYVSRYYGQRVPRSSQNSWIDGPGGPGNQLWRNLGNWKFEEVSRKANAQAGRRSCFTSCWLDANNDGAPDIYVINEFGGGVLLVNNGNGTFREMPLLNDAGDFGSMGMTVGDYNNDGNIDVYTANMYSKAGRRIMENLSPGSYSSDVFTKMKRFVTGSEMYRNVGDLKFERIGKALRVHAVGWAYGASLVDLDNDGFLDLYGTAGFVSVNKEEPDG